MEISAGELLTLTQASLTQIPEDERVSFTYAFLEDLYGLSKTDLLLNKKVQFDQRHWQDLMDRLNAREPLQHVAGFSWFRGRKFLVNRDTLIPRPETEELVDHVKQSGIKNPRILDIGTGTGCLAISLALEIPGARVTGIDISERALVMAQRNSDLLGSEVELKKGNILDVSQNLSEQTFDVIVSNPPYIRELEKAEMEVNVLDYEPHVALFVSDEDPLVFYRAIASFGANKLTSGGYIWSEINSYLGKETYQLFADYGFEEVEIIRDFYGRDRFVKAKKRSMEIIWSK